jgi:hypothetical protein
MKQPVDHILRPSLPWREAAPITECGYDASKVSTLTREQFRQRKKELGAQRTAMLTCMTCSQTAGRWGTWDDDPRLALQREIEWERGGGAYYHDSTEHGQRLRDELLAVAALIEAHRQEFDEHVKGTEGRREWIARKAQMGRGHDA